MGVDEAAARAYIASQEPEGADGQEGSPGDGGEQAPFEVWPENWAALGLFMRVQTQWRRDEQRRPLGLRHEAVQAAMAMLKIEDTARLYDEIVQMEHAALEAFHGD